MERQRYSETPFVSTFRRVPRAYAGETSISSSLPAGFLFWVPVLVLALAALVAACGHTVRRYLLFGER